MKLLSRYVTLRFATDRSRDRGLTRDWRAQVVLKVLADAGSKVAMLVITVVAARRLNPDPFAILALAMATGWLLGVATDAGLSMYLARETARQPRRGRHFVREIVSIRAGLAFLGATIILFATPSLVPRHWRMQFVLVVAAQLCGAVLETIAHYFRGLQRSEIESAIHAGYRLVMLALALVVLWQWRRLDYLAIAMLVPGLIALAVSLIVAWRLATRLEREAIDRQTGGLTPEGFLRDVFPLGAAMLVSALYFRIDVYFIQQWHGFQPVGGYNAAFRLLEALRLLPAGVMAVTFPLLVHARDTSLVRRIGGTLAIAGGAFALVCAAGAPVIMPLIYGVHYAYAVPAFAVLSLALPLFFLNYALTHQVIGWDGHREYLAIVTTALAGNIAANILLVPERGLVGAAIATLVTEVIVTAGCVYVLARHKLALGRFAAPQHEGSPT